MSLEFKINQIWLNLVLWILIQILFRIYEDFDKEICSLFQYLHTHILFENFRATEDFFGPVQIQIDLKFI
jgi:hypothetical protein